MVNRYITNAEGFSCTNFDVDKCSVQRQRDVHFLKRFEVPCTVSTHTLMGACRVVNRCVSAICLSILFLYSIYICNKLSWISVVELQRFSNQEVVHGNRFK